MNDLIVLLLILFVIVTAQFAIIWSYAKDIKQLKAELSYDAETTRSLNEQLAQAIKNDSRDPRTGRYTGA